MTSCKTIISSPFASHDSRPCSIQIDNKSNETRLISWFGSSYVSPIYRRGKMYVEWEYTNSITCRDSC